MQISKSILLVATAFAASALAQDTSIASDPAAATSSVGAPIAQDPTATDSAATTATDLLPGVIPGDTLIPTTVAAATTSSAVAPLSSSAASSTIRSTVAVRTTTSAAAASTATVDADVAAVVKDLGCSDANVYINCTATLALDLTALGASCASKLDKFSSSSSVKVPQCACSAATKYQNCLKPICKPEALQLQCSSAAAVKASLVAAAGAAVALLFL
ncbi:hypothetical protein HDU96_006426 [Phlyctochytrium bullatum]|nr:hypothetical protein HDU96_006426 [Phlyctochytrium bullatum]